MLRMGIREVRDRLAIVIRQVRQGETIEITDHGRPVARIVPLCHRSRFDRLVAEGRIQPGDGRLSDCEPLPPPPASKSVSDVLSDMRASDR
ncbi:MAG TPA: type II toxin-antitoxin system prevent-host-death family antitoxin [Candidatus Dormibacteraeota bacterium]|jgi:prevent-host-death family protein|nr:type II toxin-antitoxin system prevent-host-death family antitoxin [Candidatus Dormibacteraeota bacterium]